MAGAGRKVFTGEVLSVPDVQDYLMDQAVMAFDNAAERSALLPNPTDGNCCYLADTGRVELRHGGAWRLLKYVGAVNAAAEPAARLTRAGSNGTTIPHLPANTATRMGGWTVDKGSGSLSVAADGTITVLERAKLDVFMEIVTDATVTGGNAAWLAVSGRPARDSYVPRATGYAGAGLLRQPISWAGYVEPNTTVAAWAQWSPSSGTATAVWSGEMELVLS